MKPDRKSLRFRISVAFGVSCAFLALIFAGSTYLAYEAIRPGFAALALDHEFDAFIDSGGDPRATEAEWTWSGADGAPGSVKDLLPVLGVGHHVVETREGIFEIEVDSERGRRYAVALEHKVVLDRERIASGLLAILILAAVCGSGTLGCFWGAHLSDLILTPLKHLAGRVAALPEQPDGEPLTPAFGADEVGELARAFDDHRSRLAQFINREQTFVADAGHEIRNGISVITSSVEVLLDSSTEPRQRQRLERLLRAARRLRDLAQVLLYLARESDLHQLPRAEPIDRLLQDLVQERLPRAQGKGKSIELEIQGGDVRTKVPPEAVAMVIGNLMDNALTHAHGTVVLRANPEGFTVDDDGPGLPEETLSRVFERGVRGHRAADSGFGLGLSIVRRLCERYGWSVLLSNLPEKGARAEVRWPDLGTQSNT